MTQENPESLTLRRAAELEGISWAVVPMLKRWGIDPEMSERALADAVEDYYDRYPKPENTAGLT